MEGFAAGADAVAEHDVADAGFEEAEEIGYESAVVLVIGVEHDDDVGAVVEGGVVAGFLVGAVAAVDGVADDGQAEALGDFDGVVAGAVIDEDEFGVTAGGDVADGGFEGGGGVVGGQDDDGALELADGGDGEGGGVV